MSVALNSLWNLALPVWKINKGKVIRSSFLIFFKMYLLSVLVLRLCENSSIRGKKNTFKFE